MRENIRKEKAEILLFPEEEKEEVRDIFKKMGIKEEILDPCVESITANEDKWLEFLIKNELGLEEHENPIMGALFTFFSFIVGALIPQLPYFLNLGVISLIFSSIVSLSSLFIVGGLKTKITGESAIKGGIEMVLIGIVAFTASLTIGLWLEQLFPL